MLSGMPRPVRSQCTFWCSVLSDRIARRAIEATLRVSMHLLVLSAFRPAFWDSGEAFYSVSMHLLVLSAFRRNGTRSQTPTLGLVSMHLLVLSAFRRNKENPYAGDFHVSMHLLVLSAFRHEGRGVKPPPLPVSMHLLVLSAFRLVIGQRGDGKSFVSMHLLVLSAFRQYTRQQCVTSTFSRSQCTFWCSVLSDGERDHA